MWETVTNRSGWGAATKRYTITMICAVLLSACSADNNPARVSVAPPPPTFIPSDVMADRAPTSITLKSTTAAVISENQTLTALTSDPPVPAGCRIKDRFDRSSLWSLSSPDGRKKLALDVDTSGLSVEGAMLRYSFKLQPGKNAKKKEHCLYPSHIQGLAPSAYREMVKRKSDTVWQHLKGLKADIVE